MRLLDEIPASWSRRRRDFVDGVLCSEEKLLPSRMKQLDATPEASSS